MGIKQCWICRGKKDLIVSCECGEAVHRTCLAFCSLSDESLVECPICDTKYEYEEFDQSQFFRIMKEFIRRSVCDQRFVPLYLSLVVIFIMREIFSSVEPKCKVYMPLIVDVWLCVICYPYLASMAVYLGLCLSIRKNKDYIRHGLVWIFLYNIFSPILGMKFVIECDKITYLPVVIFMMFIVSIVDIIGLYHIYVILRQNYKIEQAINKCGFIKDKAV
ncbi:MAG: hypothetical protein Harvfovirus32_15 [Harvfovirus sp.]|uniref:RING-type domain-containing protein n=1 Tax=Harvfovirus sp. TaxID=2487768 RepID=A0A3G5A7J0_9VIRU|nr:MAG: hypothetical protein Harvfovirus32_15 [Harvfovirus sp.]